MAGLYIHIPFCKTRCIYCDFYSQTNKDLKNRFLENLEREIQVTSSDFCNETFSSVYFGGGTPSLLSAEDLEKIVSNLRKHYKITSQAEWTFEANPDDVKEEYAYQLQELGINRVSLGVQSFLDTELTFLNRRHSSEQVFQAIDSLRRAGINNISIDLIYALPNQTLEQWKENLKQAIELDVPHISAYHLIYEEGTKLKKLLEKKKIKAIEEDGSIQAYQTLIEYLSKNNYQQYEVSNFAKKGMDSHHNSSYWERTPYLGLGPAAHSFYEEQRWSNVADIQRYCSSLETNELPRSFVESLSIKDQYNEWVMLGLRTRKGIKLDLMKKALPEEMMEKLKDSVQLFCKQGLLEYQGEYLRASNRGFLLIDGIIADLFLE